MLVRIRQNVSVHNPLLHSIKAMSPIIYDIAAVSYTHLVINREIHDEYGYADASVASDHYHHYKDCLLYTSRCV